MIEDPRDFYLGTKQLQVNHGSFIARYGEISKVEEGIKKGVHVKKGQLIAYVGELKFSNGKKMSMLHLELYKGTVSGRLTNRSNKPYQRRSDLINPTPYLDKAKIGTILHAKSK